jgi:putative hydrolase of the HAD superfamily
MIDDSTVRAVSFDAAGTLMRPAEPVGVTYARHAARFGATFDSGALEAGFRRAFASQPPLAFATAAPGGLRAREYGWWRDLVRTTVDGLGGLPDFERYFAQLYAHYARGAAWQVYPDVRVTLTRLRRRGLKLGVLSNFDSRLTRILEELDLSAQFDHVVYSTAAGAAKPDERIFAHIRSRFGLEPGAILHIGDDRAVDYEGARAAGFRARWLDRRDTGAPDAIPSLAELVAD